MLKSLIFSSIALNLGLLLGRLSGFVREAFVAHTYGTTSEADIVVLMLSVPDLLINLLVGGALGVVLIPEFTSKPHKAKQILYQAILLFGGIFSLISLIFYFNINELISILVPGFSSAQQIFAGEWVRYVIWLLPLTVMSGIITAFLHHENKFVVPAMGTLIINVFIIFGLLFSQYFSFGLQALVFAVLIGGCIRLLSQFLNIDSVQFNPITALTPLLLNRSLFLKYFQAMASGGVLLFFPIFARATMSFYDEGSVATFSYAMKLIDFPLLIGVTFLSVILFPRLSKSYSNDKKLFVSQVFWGVRLTFLMSISVMILLVILCGPYVEIVYGYGGVDIRGLNRIKEMVALGLLSLPFQGISIFIGNIFYSQKKSLLPLISNFFGLIFFIVLNLGIFFVNGDAIWVIKSLVASYGLIFLLNLFFAYKNGINLKGIFLERNFLLGLALSAFIIVCANLYIIDLNLPALLSIFLGGISFLLALLSVVLSNKKIRKLIRVRPTI